MNSVRSIIIASLMTLPLIGCGGGGGGGGGGGNNTGSAAPAQYSFSLNGPSRMAESSTAQVTISESNANSATYTATSNQSGLNVSVSGKTIQLTAQNQDRPVDATITVRGQSDGKEVVKQWQVTIENNSAVALEKQINDLILSQSQMANMQEERSVFNLYAMLAEKSGTKSQSELDSDTAQLNSVIASSSSNINAALSTLSNKRTQYLNHSIGDTQLQSALNTALSSLSAAGGNVIAEVNGLIGDVGVGPTISTSGYHYDQSQGKFSQFIGNNTLGQYRNGSWEYDGAYQYMNNVVPTSTFGQVCSI